jgi:thiol-disulfide isomerase/thioredoxin
MPETPLAPPGTEEAAGYAAPDFTVLDAGGNEVRLSDFFGRPIVLNFWASWCPPCRAHKPDFDKIYDEMKADVAFLMVNLTDGQRETIESASSYIAEHGYRFPVYFDTTREAAWAYGVTSVPTTVFISKDGYVTHEHIGRMNEDLLRSGIVAKQSP